MKRGKHRKAKRPDMAERIKHPPKDMGKAMKGMKHMMPMDDTKAERRLARKRPARRRK